MLYKRAAIKGQEHAKFSMPSLKESYAVGRTADHVEREAYERGYASGEKAGFEMGEQKAKVLLDRLELLLKDLVTLKARIVKETEQQCITLAVSVAKKILVRELSVRPEEIVVMAKDALLKLERNGQITIKVNPALYDLFMKHKPELLRVHPDIMFDADPSVPRHGTVVMGPVEDVVTDVDEQIKNLIKDVVDHYAHT